MSECPNHETCKGTLILDPTSKPNWKLGCNQCNTLVTLKADIHKITVSKSEFCEECDSKLIKLEFSKLRTPLKNGEVNYEGCLACDDFLNDLTEVIAGRTTNLQVMRQMRARRNAGRGGRGRGGRGRRKRDPAYDDPF